MTSSDHLNVAGLCGSLRAASYNMAALQAAGRLMPPGMRLSVESFAQVPIYSPDEQERGWPTAVLALGAAIARADAVLVASPEYNFSVPGGLKNTLDWLSRLPQQPFKGKPVAILGAATGPLGTARMQYDLRRIFHSLEAQVLLKPEVFIGHANTKFDAEGRLVDEVTLKFLADQMQALRRLIVREQAASRAEE
ncbi:MAG TPA: NADPH-dependent FMN reductase [Ramlibacter sp.]|nr:NADPH-dependent FMN reductase [Ramlibacter sp.]